MEKEQHIYEHQGMEEYIKYQVEHEMQPFTPGPAFSFVKVRSCSHTRGALMCLRSKCHPSNLSGAVRVDADTLDLQFSPAA